MFALTLANYLLTKSTNSNLSISPVSLHVMLSLLAIGSKGPTQDPVLSFVGSKHVCEIKDLAAQVVGSVLNDGSTSGGPVVKFVNGVWIDFSIKLKEEFEAFISEKFKAEAKNVDFQTQVKTVDGNTELQIPPGTQPGDVVVLSKRGVPKLNRPSIRGDHLFTIKVTIPKRISAREKELLEELAYLVDKPGSRVRHRPSSEPQIKRSESTKSVETEEPEKSTETEEPDLWQSIKDLAGSAAKGVLKWLKDNL